MSIEDKSNTFSVIRHLSLDDLRSHLLDHGYKSWGLK